MRTSPNRGAAGSRTPGAGGVLARVCGLLVSLLPLGCNDAPAVATRERPAQAVEVVEVREQPATQTLSMSGLVEAKSRTELSFRMTGFVARIPVEEGDWVEAGEVLAELDGDDLELEVRAAEAEVERAVVQAGITAREFDRAEQLLGRKSTSRSRFDETRAARDVANAELRIARVRLEEAKKNLDKATLVAPLSGYIERRLLEVHEAVPARTPVIVLTELDTVVVRAAVADALAWRLRPGLPARVRAPNRRERSFEGVIARIDVAADPSTRTIPFEVEMPNPDLALRPEMSVELEIPIGEAEPRLLVPMGAVLRDVTSEPFCFVAVEDGSGHRSERRAVQTGGVHGNRIAIASGLQPGARVIVRGQHFLRSGDPVRIVEADPLLAVEE